MTDSSIIYTNFGPRVDETYLGDAVYASHDSYQIWLRVNDQHIALDQSTFRALVEYAKRIGVVQP